MWTVSGQQEVRLWETGGQSAVREHVGARGHRDTQWHCSVANHGTLCADPQDNGLVRGQRR